MKQAARFYVGIDWATERHQVCVLDDEREVVKEFGVDHTGKAIAELAEFLSRLADPSEIAVSIEIPRGAIVESLAERGFRVFHINPKQLDRFRDRHTVAGAKDDRRDAFVLADSLATDGALYRPVALDDPLVIELRELARVDDDLSAEINGHTNRVREQLLRYYPAHLQLSGMTEEWAWALWEACPEPGAAPGLKLGDVVGLLRAHRIRRIDAKAALKALREPALRVAEGTPAAAMAHIGLAIPRLRLATQQQRTVRKRMAEILDELGANDDDERSEHRDAAILLSMPGVGTKVAATVLVEASTALAERDYSAARAHAGIAPVTLASGKRSKRRAKVQMRHACNKRLRNAMYHWARVASMHDPRAKAAYTALRGRGHTHGRALRSVADQLLRVLFGMLRTGTLYDPTHPRREQVDAAAA